MALFAQDRTNPIELLFGYGNKGRLAGGCPGPHEGQNPRHILGRGAVVQRLVLKPLS